MSLSTQHINTDATFVIKLTLPQRSPPPDGEVPLAFSILLDPWLHSDAPVFHPRFSNQLHTAVPAIPSLAELSPAPDIIVVSQRKSDHCHEGTLKDLAWSDCPGTRLYACPGAVPIIKGWKWFPQSQLRAFKKGEPVHIEIPNTRDPELRAWVELEYIPAKWPWETPSLHSAIGIKYFFHVSPSTTKVISVLFTPHGVPVSALRPWLSRLPGVKPWLSLLLHPFKHVYSLGGEISLGFETGMELCQAADVKIWVSAHDEEKVIEGFVKSHITVTAWDCQKVEEDLSAAGIKGVEVKELSVLEQLRITDGVVVNA